jgi:hypothetical protein
MGFKLLTLMTAVGLGIIGLVIWVWFASYPTGGSSQSGTCTSGSDRNCTRVTRDGSVWLVQQDGRVLRLSVGRN